MISKTIGYNGVHYFQTNPYHGISWHIVASIGLTFFFGHGSYDGLWTMDLERDLG